MTDDQFGATFMFYCRRDSQKGSSSGVIDHLPWVGETVGGVYDVVRWLAQERQKWIGEDSFLLGLSVSAWFCWTRRGKLEETGVCVCVSE